MKHIWITLFVAVFLQVVYASKYQFKALLEISKALARKNHEVSVISVNESSDFIEFAVLPNFMDLAVPHSVMAFEDLNSPEYKGINTSAVISFDSIHSLQKFNNETSTCKK